MTDLRSRDDLPSSGDPEPGAGDSSSGTRHRRARRLSGALGVTLLGTVVPGAGLVWTRRRWAWLLVLASLGGAAYLAYTFRDLQTAIDLAFDPDRLRLVAWGTGGVLVVWTST